MLYISLVASAVLLVAVNAAARRPECSPLGTAACGLAAAFPCFFLTPVVVQAILLCAISPLWRRSGRGPARFLALSAGATLAAYGVAGLLAVPTHRELTRLRDRFPYESLEGRVPLLPARPTAAPHDPARLEAMEAKVGAGSSSRAYHLEQLHEHAVRHFVNSPGFGVARMVPGPSEARLAYDPREGPAPPQPAGPDPSYWGPGATRPGPPTADRDLLLWLHDEGVLGFVRPNGFGFVKDRAHVAGFQSHGFGRVPAPASGWKVGRLGLVGLLLHDGPVVYVSDRLPRMDDVRGGPTRPLDVFEAEGLESLRRGEDLFVRGDRMVGSVRATKQCIGCHGGSRGDLFGAFTYTLRPATP